MDIYATLGRVIDAGNRSRLPQVALWASSQHTPALQSGALTPI